MMRFTSGQSGLFAAAKNSVVFCALRDILIEITSKSRNSDVAQKWNKCSDSPIAETIDSKILRQFFAHTKPSRDDNWRIPK
jgi:hypothetical protein